MGSLQQPEPATFELDLTINFIKKESFNPRSIDWYISFEQHLTLGKLGISHIPQLIISGFSVFIFASFAFLYALLLLIYVSLYS